MVGDGVTEDDLSLLYVSEDILNELDPFYLSYFVDWNSYKNYQLAKKFGFHDLTHEWDRTHTAENFDQVDSRAYLVHAWMKYPKFGHASATDYTSRFIYRLTDSENKKITAVRFSATRQNGTVENENLGNATGKLQTFALPHRAKTESININGSWHYDEDTQILNLTSAVNDTLKLSYDWCGIIPQVKSFVVGAEYSV